MEAHIMDIIVLNSGKAEVPGIERLRQQDRNE